MPISPTVEKLLRRLLDPSVEAPEAETARRKLFAALQKDKLNGHDIVDVVNGNVQPVSTPDYGLSVFP
jgi:hypothetical protein